MNPFLIGLIGFEVILFIILWFFVSEPAAWWSLFAVFAIFACFIVWNMIKNASVNALTSGLLPPEVAAFMVSVFGDRIVESTTGLIEAVKTIPEKIAILGYIGIFIYVVLPYIVLITVIILIYYYCNGGKRGGSSTNKKQRSSSLLSSGARQNLYSINPFGAPLPTIARPIIYSGRCDNINFIEDSAEGNAGHCEVSQVPDDITWSIDEAQLPELISLPSDLQKSLQPKLSITIPYTKNPEESFFVPQCDQAKYSDNTPATLYTDLGMSCALNKKSIIKSTNINQDQNAGYYE